MHTPCGREAGTAEPFAPAPRRLQAREPNGMRKRREVGQHTSSVRSTSIPRQLRVAERVHAPRLALARILGVVNGGGWSGASSSSDAPSSSPSSSLRHSNPGLHPRIRPVLRQAPDGLPGNPPRSVSSHRRRVGRLLAKNGSFLSWSSAWPRRYGLGMEPGGANGRGEV